MPIRILPIQSSDIASVVDCIQRAFATDPYFIWVFDKSFNKHRNFASLKAKCEWGMRSSYALFYVAKDLPEGASEKDARNAPVLGVSMWTTPASRPQCQTWLDTVNDYSLWFQQGFNVLWYQGWGGLIRGRYWIWKREQAICQEEILTDPEGYYFVNIVTVNPEAQGKGIGRKLFEIVMNKADAEGRKCYLESSCWEPNVRIYNKMGFDVRKKMVLTSEDEKRESVDLFCMVRESAKADLV